MTVRPAPSVLQAPGQIHLYKRGKKAHTTLHRKAIPADTLRKAGVVNGGASWAVEERAMAARLQERNVARVEAVEIIGGMKDQDRKKRILGVTGGRETTPDYVIGDVTVDLKTLKNVQGKTIDSRILRDLEGCSRQASAAVVDARHYPMKKEDLASPIEDRTQVDKVPSEFVIIGQYDGKEYELIWP